MTSGPLGPELVHRVGRRLARAAVSLTLSGDLLDVEWMNVRCAGSRTPAEAQMLSQIGPDFCLKGVSVLRPRCPQQGSAV